MHVKGNIFTNLHQHKLTSTQTLSDKQNFSKDAVLSFRSAGSDMKMRYWLCSRQQKTAFQTIMGRIATYLLICPKRLNTFYADVASPPRAVHYSVTTMASTLHVCKQLPSGLIKFIEIECYFLLLKSDIITEWLSCTSIIKSSFILL